MGDDSLVEAFEARGEQRHGRLGGQLLDHRLRHRPALRRQGDDTLLGASP
jgi:hypothetical protein